MKQINLQADYTSGRGHIQLCLPIDTETWIPVDDSVRLLERLLEELDYLELYRSYSFDGRKPAIAPKTMFKVLVYAYTQGVYSSREIERRCHRDLAFRWLLQGANVPDHNTIARFRRERLSTCAESLLTQLVERLADYGEIDFRHLFVDGTKIEANANRYTFVWQKATTKYAARLQDKVRAFLQTKCPLIALPTPITADLMDAIVEDWQHQALRVGIAFVYGKGKHKSPLQRDIEMLQAWSLKQRQYDHYLALLGSRPSFSKTDPDATFMRLKEDHMRNGQLKPAYNLQIGVESEYIVGLDLSSERNDMYTLKPFLARLQQNYGHTWQTLVADAGYESEENYHYLDDEQIVSYVKPSNYEYAKTRAYAKAMAFRHAMAYQPQEDCYVCADGRTLHFIGYATSKRKSGYKSSIRRYECASCEGCPYLGQCYRGKYAKRIEVNDQFDRYRQESLDNITSPLGIQLRMNRSIQAEGAFGSLKWNRRFRRFLLRGEAHVRTECLLLALAFNVNKLHSRIQNGRLGIPLFSLPSSA